MLSAFSYHCHTALHRTVPLGSTMLHVMLSWRKVLEESPSCLINAETRLAMQQQAIMLSKATGYRYNIVVVWGHPTCDFPLTVVTMVAHVNIRLFLLCLFRAFRFVERGDLPFTPP